ncbi:uncharacterized protein LOC113151995 isoform X2 [Anabas testudineus]|uniref:uncharacterized protein LOC113151995 isoform X2 n=1 Tax=Anabas testudineus TaxID=64144 RepID=UPI000E46074E|nr:uncharacterized protein LOC113151995 isoform X2 [Anabas testudineus]
MSAIAGPTLPTSLLSSYQLTVIAASVSSLVFFVIIVVVLSIIYHKDPLCCKVCSFQGPHGDMDAPPQYYSSRQTLVGSHCLEQTQSSHMSNDMNDNTQQAGQLFFVGLPSSYSLPTLEPPLPRLPSYESVRKKDRQRQIHMMIADRFGLNGPIVTEPPPTYEESIRQSVVLPYNILSSSLDISPHQSIYTNMAADIQTDTRRPISCDASSTVLPV